MTEVVAPTYFVRPDAATGAQQLVRYDGFRTDRPVVDNVVDAHFEFFGDPRPPRVLPRRWRNAGTRGCRRSSGTS